MFEYSRTRRKGLFPETGKKENKPGNEIILVLFSFSSSGFQTLLGWRKEEKEEKKTNN